MGNREIVELLKFYPQGLTARQIAYLLNMASPSTVSEALKKMKNQSCPDIVCNGYEWVARQRTMLWSLNPEVYPEKYKFRGPKLRNEKGYK